MTEQASALAHLMGAYFHQDWFDAGTEDDVVAKFVSEEPDMALGLIDDIDVALATYSDEEFLRDYLRSLGCAYNPDRRYGSYRNWLQEVSRRARAHTRGE